MTAAEIKSHAKKCSIDTGKFIAPTTTTPRQKEISGPTHNELILNKLP
tara:strand:+ start:2309 stop:2452 length:144 start_codon:yes stop_codon:yes gene_type:complete